MTTPEASSFSTPSKSAKALLFNVEQAYEAHAKTDHVFMNWWQGTFLMGLVTFSLYWHYRYYRNIARRDAHFARTHQFYAGVEATLQTVSNAQGSKSLAKDLRAMTHLLNNKETKKLVKPVRWWLVLIVTILGNVGHEVLYENLWKPSLKTVLLPFINAVVPASMAFPVFMGVAILSLLVLIIPFYAYPLIVEAGLMKDYSRLEQLEISVLEKTKLLLKESGAERINDINYIPQCKPRSFWLHFLLTLPTCGLNWLYVDYFLITEPALHFNKAQKTQYQILQALRQCVNKNPERLRSLEVKGSSTVYERPDEFLPSDAPFL